MATKAKTKTKITEESIEMLENDDCEDLKTSYLETGDIGFDMVLSNGKGLPVGASVLLWAAYASGKTTLVGDMIKRLIKTHKAKGEVYKALYLDVEGSKDLLIAMGLGEYIKSHDLIYVGKGLRWRNIEPFMEAILANKPPYDGVKLVVIDSVTNILSDSNENKSVADPEFGTKAKERGNFYNKYLPKLKEAGINSIFISQIRQNQDATFAFAEKKRAAITDGDKHNVDIIIKCKANLMHKDTEKIESKTAFGTDKTVSRYILELDPTHSSCKNRYAKTHRCEVMIDKGVGVQNFYALRKLLTFHDFVTESGGWFGYSQAFCDFLGIPVPDKKLRKEEVNELIEQNMGKIVAFLKENGCYSVASPEKVRKISGSEDVEEEEEE